MGENGAPNMAGLRRITLAALALHLPVAAMCFYLNMYAEWFGMELVTKLFFALWIATFFVLLVGHELRRTELARRVCLAGLALFVLTLASVSWGYWFRWHGVLQPWEGISPDNVSRVALGLAYGEMVADTAEAIPELAFIREWDSSVTLTEEEQRQAVELIMATKVRNPVRNGGVLWDDPAWLPESEGEATEHLTFYYGKNQSYNVVVNYPYINGWLAVDEAQARELEAFINGLCEKYTAELAEYRAGWDRYNQQLNEELDKWRAQNDMQ